ncbi:hemolysin type calcium-binding protein, partial [Limnobacter thiooxidans]
GGNDTVVAYNLVSDGEDEINLGTGDDVVNVTSSVTMTLGDTPVKTQASQIRVTFTSAEVGNGSAFDSTDSKSAMPLANQDGDLAVRLQAEDAEGNLVGSIARTDDEGITFLTEAGTTFDVRDLVAGTQRGNQFNRVTLGSSAGDTITIAAPEGMVIAPNVYINSGAGDDTVTAQGGADFLVGGVGNDTLTGGAGVDTLLGGAGNDTLIGNDGEIDTLNGGDGSDTYRIDLDDMIVEGAGLMGDVDTIEIAATYTLGASFENLTLLDVEEGEDNSFTAVGNSGNNVITGNAGDNQLLGLAGDDTIYGGEGTDFVSGGDGADMLHGDDGDDTISGGNGDDTLFGGNGNDSLTGDAGADTMSGGRGDDTYRVDSQSDIVIESSNEGVDTVNATVSYTLSAHVDRLTLINSANAIDGTGNDIANRVVGNANNNTLRGLDGADTLLGAAGNDVLYGGSGNDRLEGSAGQDTFVFENGDYQLSSLFNLVPGGNSYRAAMDIITDFVSGESVDLSRIDANSILSGDNAFVNASNSLFNLTGVPASGNAGTLRLSGGTTGTTGTINLYIDDDAVVDMSIQFIGVSAANLQVAINNGNIIL